MVRLLGVRGPVTALVQRILESTTPCTKAVTGPRTPRRRTLLEVGSVASQLTVLRLTTRMAPVSARIDSLRLQICFLTLLVL
jgi:hypothetical protein